MGYVINVGNENLLKIDLEMCVDHPFYYALDILIRYARFTVGEEYSVIIKIDGQIIDGYKDIGAFVIRTRMTGYYYHKLESVSVDKANKKVTLEV